MQGDKQGLMLSQWLAERSEGTYLDGRRFDELGYLQCKLILKPDRFTSARVFKEFAQLVRQAAEATGVDFRHTRQIQERPKVREVLFFDTGGFHLYNHGFILRRRIAYEDGFPVADPEIVFKFRTTDMVAAQTMDVRPRISGSYRIKFKIELMPLKERIGGVRRLLAHNVEFGLSQAPEADRLAMASLGHLSLPEIQHLFPPLETIACDGPDDIALVNQCIVEELMQDICELDFGNHARSVANLALWRSRGDHRAFVGEFAFQLRFARPDDIGHKAQRTCERFFLELQQTAAEWLALTTTKTGAVYRLNGNPPQAHE